MQSKIVNKYTEEIKKILPYQINVFLPEFKNTCSKNNLIAFSAEKLTTEDWFNIFKSLVLKSINEKKFFPVCRFCDGEFIFMNNGLELIDYRLKIKDKIKILIGNTLTRLNLKKFNANTQNKYSSGHYSYIEIKALNSRYKKNMKFGILKSKIDYVLSESFKNDIHFKEEMKLFKKYILENKNISKLFYLYEELSSKKNVNKNIVNDYINESITIYENTINKVKTSDIKRLNEWLLDIKVENQYEQIDNVFSNDILTLENKIQSKKVLAESLTKSEKPQSDVINLPLSSMLKMANTVISNYIEGLNESDKKELEKLLSENDSELKSKFDVMKEEVINKLINHRDNSDTETSTRIEETISKIKNEKFDKLSFYKLKSLKESI